jgi:mono/diheme cytochrome c family protein
MCAECHAIDRSRPSPNLKATPFGTVADTPGMTATALAVWLRTPHPTMPNLIVADGDLGDIIAYVLSLQTPR